MPPFEGQVRLKPAQATSSHWHPNSREILKHVSGQCSVFVLDSFLVSEAVASPTDPLPTLDFQLLDRLGDGPGEVKETTVPHAHLHYIINDGHEELVLDTEFDLAEPLVVFLAQTIQGSIQTYNPENSLNAIYGESLSQDAIYTLDDSRFLASPPN